jgi:starch phosphorylase
MKIQASPESLPSQNGRKGTDKDSIKKSFTGHLTFSRAKDVYSATPHDYYTSLALTVRDRMVDRWIQTQQTYYKGKAKRVYYLSLEFLIGRTLGNSIINLQMHQATQQALEELGIDLEELRDVEVDAGLGNGGLGRLAACFMDSLASLQLPAHGYGIRYEYGIFTQKIEHGYQVETADKWLELGNPWELARPEVLLPVKFYGRVEVQKWPDGRERFVWVDGHDVFATPYDTPVPGYGNNTVNSLRLWAAKATNEFELSFFNSGDYVAAVETKNQDENISRVLYPNDNFAKGKELRLKQQYFFVSATIQDALRRFRATPTGDPERPHFTLEEFPDHAVFQLNDTHPVIAIPELMRILMDEEGLEWEAAWSITSRVFNYTNHTVLPEALEKWPVGLLEHILPRHMQIIREIDRRFRVELEKRHPGDAGRMERMAIITGGHEPQVRMANLAIIACGRVNGVAALHTEILKSTVFPEFHAFYPGKFLNVTNGITHRRWLRKCNTELSRLLTKQIGDVWIRNLDELRRLEPLAADPLFRQKFHLVKRFNKVRLAEHILKQNGVHVSLDSMFDCQIKRFHEYKRQLLNILGVIARYNRIKADPKAPVVPRTVIFAGKSAPGYFMAKLIIKLINSVGDVVNNDPEIGNKLKVVFLANYSVSLAEKIIPAADLSEQISTAGMEASGTGNMKFALNGALTIGTLDGANVEIGEEVGWDNIFIFGLKAHEVDALRKTGYHPHAIYEKNPELKRVLDMIRDNAFSPEQPGLFQPILDSLLGGGDFYLLLEDFASYMACQDEVDRTYADQDLWYEKAILNVARMGKFSSDRAIREYAENIWKIKPVQV